VNKATPAKSLRSRGRKKAELEKDAPQLPPERERCEGEDEKRQLAGQVAQHELVGHLLVVCCHRLNLELDPVTALAKMSPSQEV
jgi:hypothetical protein